MSNLWEKGSKSTGKGDSRGFWYFSDTLIHHLWTAYDASKSHQDPVSTYHSLYM